MESLDIMKGTTASNVGLHLKKQEGHNKGSPFLYHKTDTYIEMSSSAFKLSFTVSLQASSTQIEIWGTHFDILDAALMYPHQWHKRLHYFNTPQK